jgi:hypothetical protein
MEIPQRLNSQVLTRRIQNRMIMMNLNHLETYSERASMRMKILVKMKECQTTKLADITLSTSVKFFSIDM